MLPHLQEENTNAHVPLRPQNSPGTHQTVTVLPELAVAPAEGGIAPFTRVHPRPLTHCSLFSFLPNQASSPLATFPNPCATAAETQTRVPAQLG